MFGNLALGGVGGSGGNGGDAMGGGILSIFLGGAAAPSLTVTTSQVVGNEALGGTAGSAGNGGNGLGGGIDVASGTACLDSSTIVGNLAQGGSAGSGGTSGQGIGGGLYVDPSATAGGQPVHLFGNLASTSNNDLFGDLNPNC